MEYIIRQAGHDDTAAVKRVYSEARAFMRVSGNDKQWINGYPENCMEEDLINGVLYVCEIPDKDTETTGDPGKAGTDARIVSAFTLIYGHDPLYDYIEGSWKNELPYAVIHRMGVDDSARGSGAAGYIMEQMFIKYGNIRVDTHDCNAPMKAFLKKQGYEECGCVYMGDGTPRTAFQKTAGLILGSASPRRRELMHRLCRPFVSETSDAEEIIPAGLPAEATAEYLSGLKAEDIYKKHPGETVTVIGSDTIVIENGRIYGKPHTKDQAYGMLKDLSGKTHEVRTGVTVISGDGPSGKTQRFSFTDVTEVEFYELTDEEIWSYIATGEPMDKAGAYGIQGQGALLIKAIRGDFYTVMGFPVSRIYRELKNHGI